MKITKIDLYRITDQLNSITNYQYDFSVEYAYNSPRLYAHDKSREISPRLSTSQLYTWINAYIDGIAVGYNLLESKQDSINSTSD